LSSCNGPLGGRNGIVRVSGFDLYVSQTVKHKDAQLLRVGQRLLAASEQPIPGAGGTNQGLQLAD
jgi:hypothetical protein